MGSHGEQFVELLEGFKQKYPFIELKGIGANTVKTVNRIAMEVKAGRVTLDIADVSADGTYTLAGEGALQKPMMAYPHLKDFESRLQPSSGLFVVISLNNRPQGMYNTELVPPAEAPTNWEEMTDPKWTGMTIISASGEDIPGSLAWLWRKDGELNWERSFAFYEKLFQQEPLITKGYRRGAEQVAAGEKAIFWFTPPGPASRFYYEGVPLALICFPQLLMTPRAPGIVNGAPHPAAAWLFTDYITSPEGQFEYTDKITAALPLNGKAKPGKLAEFLLKFGGTWENSEAFASDYTMDNTAANVFNPENSKKSEDFFLEQMGVR
jgi:iron(III) transport system substrate-binding protein